MPLSRIFRVEENSKAVHRSCDETFRHLLSEQSQELRPLPAVWDSLLKVAFRHTLNSTAASYIVCMHRPLRFYVGIEARIFPRPSTYSLPLSYRGPRTQASSLEKQNQISDQPLSRANGNNLWASTIVVQLAYKDGSWHSLGPSGSRRRCAWEWDSLESRWCMFPLPRLMFSLTNHQIRLCTCQSSDQSWSQLSWSGFCGLLHSAIACGRPSQKLSAWVENS